VVEAPQHSLVEVEAVGDCCPNLLMVLPLVVASEVFWEFLAVGHLVVLEICHWREHLDVWAEVQELRVHVQHT
jgi:hypothetical protein